MEQWHSEYSNELVDAIEEGKIVKVSEDYAKKEGLTIIRRNIPQKQALPKKRQNEEEERLTLDDLRKPLHWRKDQVISELTENFHWQISRKRKEIGLTRKRLAQAINETENNIKLIENGLLPKNDFVIINKLQSFLKINLRKDQKDFLQSARSLITEDNREEKSSPQKETRTVHVSGSDIEIIE